MANRLFVAIKAKINDYAPLQSDFKGLIDGRWVADDNLHVTLCYFGDRFSSDELLLKLPPLLQPIEPVAVMSLGYFKHNSILYAKASSPQLTMLHERICTAFSLSDTKVFIPHVTLMRIKTVTKSERFEQMMTSYEYTALGILQTEIHLMQSHFHPEGVRYESIRIMN